MLTLNKYDLHSYDFHFSALTLLARFFAKIRSKALKLQYNIKINEIYHIACLGREGYYTARNSV